MQLADVQRSVFVVLELFAARDRDLLILDASEWSIAHRLAVYLEQQLPAGWHIDCEYNRQGLDYDEKRNPGGNIVRPDIIVHRRGHVALADNLLVIELKKYRDAPDQAKARDYTSPPIGQRAFQYQFGLTLVLLPKVNLHWYTSH